MRNTSDTPEQLHFDGFAGPAGAFDRLFFCVFPEPGVAARTADRARALGRHLGLRSQPFDADRLHVSLLKVGDFDGLPPRVVAGAKAAASSVRVPPFAVSFDLLGSFGKKRRGHHPLVLTSSQDLVGLAQLYLALTGALAANRLGAASWFTPHMTLLYDDRWLPARGVSPISWTVREFCLVHSLVGRHRYRVIGRWALTDDPRGRTP